MEIPQNIEYSYQENKAIGYQYVSLARAVDGVNQDRRSTLKFLKEGRQESNPFYGKTPSRLKVNIIMAAWVVLVPFLASSLSETWQSSIFDTLAINARNASEYNKSGISKRWPQFIGLKFTYRGF